MQLIGLFLMLISKTPPNLSYPERKMCINVDMERNLSFRKIDMFIQREINWLSSILEQCTKIQKAIRTAQTLILQQYYAPNGNVFKEA